MDGAASRQARARSFDAWADDYDRYRPSYPAELFDLISERLSLPEAADVVDTGAGTGKASLAMAARGWRVTAVEPGEPMLVVLRARAAEGGLTVSAVLARAEETGQPDAAFDLATAAQAYHWFDAPRALREIGRILRPGGGLALFWHLGDVAASPLIAELNALQEAFGGEPQDALRPGPREATRTAIRETGLFEEPAFVQVRHGVSMTLEHFTGRAFTSSVVRTLTPERQADFQRELDLMLARHGVTTGAAIELPYVIDCWIAQRAEAPNHR